MAFQEPQFSPAGDAFISVVMGKDMTFDLNVRVHAFAAAVLQSQIHGLIELVPELASVLVSFDPDQVSYDDLVSELRSIFWSTSSSEPEKLESRLFVVPVLYFDPWTEACVDEYRKDHPDKVLDPEVLCKSNDIPDRAALQRIHSSTDYWVAALGFWPGLCSLMPLDPRARLTAPKYNPPRGWTPKGTIGLGGGLTCIYPDKTPGGYQIFGRTPMPTWDREQRLAAFKESPALFRPGDRVRFAPIDKAAYDDIEAEVANGTYQHPLMDSEGFSVPGYRKWLQSLERQVANA